MQSDIKMMTQAGQINMHNKLPVAFQASLIQTLAEQPKKLEFSVYKIPNNAKILLFRDWGTGLAQAKVLMDYAAKLDPDADV